MTREPTQALIDSARAVLMDSAGNATPQYQAYLHHQQEYQRARQALNDAQANARTDPLKLQRWPVDGVAYQRAVDGAWDRWVALGYKDEIERAIHTLTAQGVALPSH